MSFLDNIPLATLKSLAFDVCIIVAYINNTITFEQAAIALGATNLGVGALGIARAKSGKGVK
jgi:hypothetical protein